MAALLAVFIAGSQLHAAPSDGITIGDVAAMEPRQAISYVYREASRRGLEIGIAHGDAALECLQREFIEITPNGDGNHSFPRGLKAAIQLVHRHNHNGGAPRLAVEQINQFVDLVAQRVCGVKSDSSSH